VDWSRYWGAGGAETVPPAVPFSIGPLDPASRGVDGALVDLEYQRMELIKFNLFDNSGTYPAYVEGRGGTPGPLLKVWPEMRLKQNDPDYRQVGGAGPQQCRGQMIRFRTITGICNDIDNPAMGATGQLFARNVEFESTYPDLGKNELARNRHEGRIDLMKPDPQVISRLLFSRTQSHPEKCNAGQGLPGYAPDAECDYQKASTLNVLAAFWVQFMTHDWFGHLVEGHNRSEWMPTGCRTVRNGDRQFPLGAKEASQLGCRPEDRVEKAYVAQANDPSTFVHAGSPQLSRAYRTSANTVTAWWDASQLYGYDERSRQRVQRDPRDPAKLWMIRLAGLNSAGDRQGYLPVFKSGDPINPAWTGQEATAFPDNWSVGLSFFHTVFAREHNQFVTRFREQADATPDADSGLRNPERPGQVIRYRDVSPDELFEVARLVIAAEIAKIHTIEWTPQLLYDEPMYLAMNANWNGLFSQRGPAAKALASIVERGLVAVAGRENTNQRFSVFASGPGIIGLGNHRYAGQSIFTGADPTKQDLWTLEDPKDINGGTDHFGSPFNFPEEFVTFYRLHAMVPDLFEFRDTRDPNAIRAKIPVVATFRGRATWAMETYGLADWALSMGRQPAGALTLGNDPQFLQNLPMPRPGAAGAKLDVAALDLIRDREHGVPRYNELRRQYGLQQLTRFDDFGGPVAPPGSPVREQQVRMASLLREVYGQHRCQAALRITDAQVNPDGSFITDCLGHPDGTQVDNVEDVDPVVGWLAESPRPWGAAISELQLQVFILNASRRLFSDRFFTSSFRPEFYATFGMRWVADNGPDGPQMEPGQSNGHVQEVSPLKRVLLRTVPELGPQLAQVRNAFDPWARDRGTRYDLTWKPRPDASADPAFSTAQ
jgi:Animal haem peroxidase